MLSRITRLRTPFLCLSAFIALLIVLAPCTLRAQDDSNATADSNSRFERHGRKYKAPPETSQIEVTVLKGFNKKPIMNAAVIFHPVDADGKDEGFLETKTDPDGKAKIDVIPTGSQVRIQVIATGFATYAEDYKIDEAQRAITIAMQRPRAQMSTYADESGKPSAMKPGVQEPVRPKIDKNGNPIPQSAPANSAPGDQPSSSTQQAPPASGSK